MWKIILITSAVFIFVVSESRAQTDLEANLPKNNIGVSIVGQGSLIALNYERLFRLRNSHFVSAGAGIGRAHEVLSFSGQSASANTFTQRLSYNIGRKRHFFEVGLSGSVFRIRGSYGSEDSGYYVFPGIGYRFQSIKKGRVYFKTYIYLPTKTAKYISVFPFGAELGISF